MHLLTSIIPGSEIVGVPASEINDIILFFFIESIKSLPESLKGELTVVLSEKINEKNVKKEIDESVKMEIKKMLKKYSHKDVVEFIAKKENLSKKIIYNFCLKFKK